ncbi:MAG: hypothetical protein PHQ81_10465 [Methanofollis sp.]|nr:hypothetical protein [Methanofollis sp.]
MAFETITVGSSAAAWETRQRTASRMSGGMRRSVELPPHRIRRMTYYGFVG